MSSPSFFRLRLWFPLMTSPADLRKLLDACRPEHADWNEPELSELADALARDESLAEQQLASQAFDRAVQARIDDVPVPPGLAERLLAQLAAAAESQVDSNEGTNSGTPVVPRVMKSELPPQPSLMPAARSKRTTWTIGLTLLVTAIAALLVVILRPTTHAPESADALAQVATQWGDTLADSAGWHADLGTAPQRYGFSRQVRAKVTGWLSLPSSYDRQGVAYALRGPLSDGWLVVQRSGASFLTAGDRPQPLPTTGPWAVHAWREGELLFVLVARNRPQHSDQFLAPRELAGVSKPTHVRPLPQPKSVDDGCAA